MFLDNLRHKNIIIMNIFDHKGIALMLLFVAEIFLVNIIIKICNFLFSDNQREINSNSL